MTDLHNYRIEDGDPDPRGYTVVTSSGQSLGRVDDLIVDTAAMKVRYLLVDRAGLGGSSESSDRILVPVDAVEVRGESSQVIAPALTGQERSWSGQRHATSTATG